MPKFTWEARFETKQAAEAIRQLKQLVESSFRGVNVELINPQSLRASEQAARAAATSVIEQQRRMTIEARTEGNVRGAAAKQEAAVIEQAARQATGVRIEQERRSTAALRAEIRERERVIRDQQRLQQQQAARPTSTGGSGGTGLGGAIAGGIAGFLTIQAAQQLAQQAAGLAEVGTQANRTGKAFEILSGGADQAAARLTAIKSAAGGTVTSLEAVTIANQAISLGIAKTTGDFERLTRAARAVTFVSPVIRNVQDAITELALASANTSYRRLDQLGLSVTEVKNRMADLMAANGGLEESQAFLQASVDALISKYGALLDTQEAQASGLERLRVAWTDLYTTIGQGVIGQGFDQLAGGIAEIFDGLSGNTSAFANIAKLSQTIQELREQASGGLLNGFDEFTGTNDVLRQQADYLSTLRDEVKLLSDAQSRALPGTNEYITKLQELLANAVSSDGRSLFTNPESVKEIERLSTLLGNLTSKTGNYGQALAALGGDTAKLNTVERNILANLVRVEQSFIDGGIEADLYAERIRKIKDAIAEVAAAKVSAASSDGGGALFGDSYAADQATTRTGQREQRGEANDGLLQQAQSGASALIASGASYDQALAILNQKKADIAAFFATLPLAISSEELDLRVAAFGAELKTSFDSIGTDLLTSAIPVDQAIAQINTSLAQLNTGAGDFIPGVDAATDSLFRLYDQIIETNFVTQDQAALLSELAGTADIAGGSTSAYTDLVAGLGENFFQTNVQGGDLLTQMLNVEQSYVTGQIGAGTYAGQMSVLVDALYRVALAAGIAKADLDATFSSVLALKSQFSGLPGFSGGVGAGNDIAAILQAQEDKRQRDAKRREAEKAAREAQQAQKTAARESEQAWKKAQRDSERAAEEMQRAVESTAQEFASVLESIPGLFSTTKVTEEDMAAAKDGSYQNKPDEYLRRLRDEVLNGKDYADVSIEEAAAGLGKIGVDVADKSKETILRMFEQAYENSSLFSDASNIGTFVDEAAVQQQLDLKEKIKAGHDNLINFFGATVESVNQAIAAGQTTLAGGVKIKLPKVTVATGGGGGGSGSVASGANSGAGSSSTVDTTFEGDQEIALTGIITGVTVDPLVELTPIGIIGNLSKIENPQNLSTSVLALAIIEGVDVPPAIDGSTSILVLGLIEGIDVAPNIDGSASVDVLGFITDVGVDARLTADATLVGVTGFVSKVAISSSLLPSDSVVPALGVVSESIVASSLALFPAKTVIPATGVIQDATVSPLFQPVKIPVIPDFGAKREPMLLDSILPQEQSIAVKWATGIRDMFAQPDVTGLLSQVGTNARAWIDTGLGTASAVDVGFEFVYDINASFSSDLMMAAMKEIGKKKIEQVYDGWKERAAELDWAGAIPPVAMSQIVDTAASQAATTVSSNLTNALANTYPAAGTTGGNKKR